MPAVESPQASLAKAAESALQISVADIGVGLRPEDCERLFEPFVQLEPAYLAHSEGAGRGLTLARRQAEARGSNLHAESAGEGHGSTLVLQLPLGQRPGAKEPR